MKETLLQFARYNTWANKRIIETMLKLGDAEPEKEVISSFPSLRKTVCHSWSAESIWLQRLQLAERPVWQEDSFQGSFEEACRSWHLVSLELEQFVGRQYDDRGLEHVFQYYNRKKQSFKNKVADVLLHVFNHATYHRGQLVTMLRQMGVEAIPGTDLISFVN